MIEKTIKPAEISAIQVIPISLVSEEYSSLWSDYLTKTWGARWRFDKVPVVTLSVVERCLDSRGKIIATKIMELDRERSLIPSGYYKKWNRGGNNISTDGTFPLWPDPNEGWTSITFPAWWDGKKWTWRNCCCWLINRKCPYPKYDLPLILDYTASVFGKRFKKKPKFISVTDFAYQKSGNYQALYEIQLKNYESKPAIAELLFSNELITDTSSHDLEWIYGAFLNDPSIYASPINPRQSPRDYMIAREVIILRNKLESVSKKAAKDREWLDIWTKTTAKFFTEALTRFAATKKSSDAAPFGKFRNFLEEQRQEFQKLSLASPEGDPKKYETPHTPYGTVVIE